MSTDTTPAGRTGPPSKPLPGLCRPEDDGPWGNRRPEHIAGVTAHFHLPGGSAGSNRPQPATQKELPAATLRGLQGWKAARRASLLRLGPLLDGPRFSRAPTATRPSRVHLPAQRCADAGCGAPTFPGGQVLSPPVPVPTPTRGPGRPRRGRRAPLRPGLGGPGKGC